jgi:hypothetical protein
MARKQVLSMVPADKYDAANAFLIGLFGDEPGSEEISMNAYLNGEDPSIATHSLGNCNCSTADAVTWENYLAVTDGCASMTFPATQQIDSWALALSAWNLKQVGA